jgi:hypothetical protein
MRLSLIIDLNINLEVPIWNLIIFKVTIWNLKQISYRNMRYQKPITICDHLKKKNPWGCQNLFQPSPRIKPFLVFTMQSNQLYIALKSQFVISRIIYLNYGEYYIDFLEHCKNYFLQSIKIVIRNKKTIRTSINIYVFRIVLCGELRSIQNTAQWRNSGCRA